METFTKIYVHTWNTSDGHVPNLRERALMRQSCGPYQLTPGDAAKHDSIGFYCASRGLAMGDGPIRLRLAWASDQEIGRQADVSGYYTDDSCGDTMQPIIARLNHARGFLAGWTMGEGMCAKLETHIYDTPEAAAMAAHSTAQYDAEEEIEYQRAEREKEEAAELAEVEDNAHEEMLP